VGFCSLLCLAVHVIALAQAATPAPAKEPAPASATPTSAVPSSATSAKKHPTSTSHTTTKHTSGQKSKSSHGKKTSKKRGQQAIDSERARQIQTALIREHYMQGQPSGTWDSATQTAMQRYQADQGWQSKTTPDSRALIKLGLGPSHDHLLNPESAMTAAPGDPKAAVKQTAAKPAPAESNVPQQ
jgi:hypothetical protein